MYFVIMFLGSFLFLYVAEFFNNDTLYGARLVLIPYDLHECYI